MARRLRRGSDTTTATDPRHVAARLRTTTRSCGNCFSTTVMMRSCCSSFRFVSIHSFGRSMISLVRSIISVVGSNGFGRMFHDFVCSFHIFVGSFHDFGRSFRFFVGSFHDFGCFRFDMSVRSCDYFIGSSHDSVDSFHEFGRRFHDFVVAVVRTETTRQKKNAKPHVWILCGVGRKLGEVGSGGGARGTRTEGAGEEQGRGGGGGDARLELAWVKSRLGQS